METSSLAQRLTSRFIAGQTLNECLQVAIRLRERGFLSSLDHLGENVSSAGEAELARAAYEDALQVLAGNGLGATVSVKLTQLGLDVAESVCLEHARALCQIAQRLGTRVEFDMESSEYTERTLRLVERLHEETGSVRAVVQAYLHRTADDIRRLNACGVPIRLCKGAYSEPPAVAIASKRDVDRNYLKLSRLLLEEGRVPAIATHDEAMVDGALEHASRIGRQAEEYEFQMLYGVRRDLQERLRSAGHRVRLYVPYGNAWYPYFMRRLAERPANAVFIARNLMGQ